MSKIKKIKKALENISIIASAVFVFGYFFLFCGAGLMQEIAIERAKPLKTKSELECCLYEEMEKLGLNNKNIAIRFGEELNTSYCKKLEANNYLVVIHPKQNKRPAIKHELYHIVSGHADIKSEFLQRLNNLLNEPKASLYGSL